MATSSGRRPSTVHRTQVVPVRVVRSDRTQRPRPAKAVPVFRPAATRRSPTGPAQVDRRMMMWVGVAAVAVTVFIFWIGFMRSYQPSAGGRDTVLEKIKDQVTSFLRSVRLFRAPVPSEQQELNDLRQRVFPEIQDQSFTTEP
ncbi:MAG: hypothetical protein HY421_02215 [Candidatus Kerfeldbacteria bacterium]|nr:hypothetical protein [Candidatus Kerfeldbacteria bacterium]